MTNKTLLDEFAIAALSGLVNQKDVDKYSCPLETKRLFQKWARDSYQIAQVMIEERPNYDN